MKWHDSMACGLLGLAVGMAGCSEDDTTAALATGTPTAQGGSAGTGGTGGTGGGGAMGGSSEGGSGQAGAPQGGAGGQGGAAAAAMDVSLNGWQMWANCMPTVPPDPINGFFGASYDNSANAAPASATITSAKIIMASGSNGLEWSFTVTPTSVGPVDAGGSESPNHDKVSASGSGVGTGAPCGYCQDNDQWTLEVQWNVGGVTVTDTIGPQAPSCAN